MSCSSTPLRASPFATMHAATSVSMATPLRAARDASRAPLRGASGSLKLASPLLGAPAVARSAAALRLGARRGAMVGARAAVMESAGRADIKLAADYLESKELSLPFADITLRAELDGATVRAHRGVLAMHSRVFAAALAEDSSKDECVLLRKSGADLRLLLGWLYRGEQFAKVRVLRGLSGSCVVRIVASSDEATMRLRRTTSRRCARWRRSLRCRSCCATRTSGCSRLRTMAT